MISIQPKQRVEIYRRHNITLTYFPSNSTWRWHFVHTTEMPFHGQGRTPVLALRSAKKVIDNLIDD